MKKRNLLYLVTLTAAFMCVSCGINKGGTFQGIVTSFSGVVQVFKPQLNKWAVVDSAEVIDFGDSLKTPAQGQVTVTFGEENSFTVGENSKVIVSLVKDEAGHNTAEVFTVSGSVLSYVEELTSKKYHHYQVRTPTSTASVEGTLFFIVFHPKKNITNVNVFKGKVRVKNPLVAAAPPVVLMPGFFTVVKADSKPAGPQKLNYGQMKKVMPLLPPGQYKKFYKKFNIQSTAVATQGKELKGKKARRGIFKAKAKNVKSNKRRSERKERRAKKAEHSKKPTSTKTQATKSVTGTIIPKKK